MLTIHRTAARALYSHINAPAPPELAKGYGLEQVTIAERVPHAWAERIVRAVNAHDELVAALALLLDDAENIAAPRGAYGMPVTDEDHPWHRSVTGARAILARLDHDDDADPFRTWS